MHFTSAKHGFNAIVLLLCFIGTAALAQDSKPSRKSSAITPAVLDELEQYIPIGTGTIDNDKTPITHAWFIHASRGTPIVCSSSTTPSSAGLKITCVAATPPTIPAPAPPGVRYRGIGVSTFSAKNTSLTQAWYIDQFSSQVYVCQALSDMKTVCAQASIPR